MLQKSGAKLPPPAQTLTSFIAKVFMTVNPPCLHWHGTVLESFSSTMVDGRNHLRVLHIPIHPMNAQLTLGVYNRCNEVEDLLRSRGLVTHLHALVRKPSDPSALRHSGRH